MAKIKAKAKVTATPKATAKPKATATAKAKATAKPKMTAKPKARPKSKSKAKNARIEDADVGRPPVPPDSEGLLETFLRVIWKRKKILLPGSFAPAIIAAAILLLMPVRYNARLTYSQWQPTRQQFGSLMAQFYDQRNLKDLTEEFRECDEEYADGFEKATLAGTEKVGDYILLEPAQEYPTSPKTKPRSADDLTKIGQMRADHLVVTISRCPSREILGKLVEVVRRDIEKGLSLHTVISRLQVDMAALHKNLAQIDSARFNTEQKIKRDEAVLKQWKNDIADVTPSIGPRLMGLDVTGAGPDSWPLEYRIPVFEAQIISAKEDLNKTEAMYAHTEKLLEFWQQCLNELKKRDVTTGYRLDDYVAFLEGLNTTLSESPDGKELIAALRSHQADIRALQCTNGPDTQSPTVGKESKGAVAILALVLAVSILVSVTGVFMAESVHRRQTA